MEDGRGVLADGTRYVRDSGEEFGANGFWQRWTRLRGVSAAGKARLHAIQNSAPVPDTCNC